ncbi:DUF3019 domain-containing protein [Permianibacter sp. IMCC34836]|uniref:DUF3019 domain-containing protein n=1 Tax=Permianibacter fluminis TaxID=2738515 RepID=UPI001551786B|nr:DUF3019 domain-containing protein [Permianibacter fluminis]NQD35695.1 DUF3019 domain-containing protein [Permianibacter fluminis]
MAVLIEAAVTDPAAGLSDSAELWLLPRSCIPRDPALPCVERVRVRWHLPAATPVCLRQRGVEQPLFCDSGAEGERELQMPVRVSTRFELWQQTGLALLASAELVVISVPTTAQRRRYQHPWSLF